MAATKGLGHFAGIRGDRVVPLRIGYCLHVRVLVNGALQAVDGAGGRNSLRADMPGLFPHLA